MTVQALKEAVIHLGFSETLDDNDALFRESAERALAELSCIVPRIASFTLYHLPPAPCYMIAGPIGMGESYTLKSPSGKSFFLRLLGKGTVRVRAGNEEKIYAVNAEGGGAESHFATLPASKSEIVFSFQGEAGLTLLSLAVYEEAYVEPPDPLGSRCYDLAKLIEDFGALQAPPLTKNGEALKSEEGGGYRLESGHLLYLSNAKSEILTLSYRRRLTLPEEGELPLSEEESQLLPLLIAAYVWLDDDPEKAAFYFNRFREGTRSLWNGFSSALAYRDRTNWG